MDDGNPITEKLKVFVSYSRAQVGFADELELALTDKGHEVLIDRHSIAKGEAFEERLGEMILACDTIVFILSDDSAASAICAWEVEEAAKLSKRMLVVTLGDLSPQIQPPSQLAGIDWVHCWTNPKVPGSSQTRGFIELDNALRTDLAWLRRGTRLLEQANVWKANTKEDLDVAPLLLRGHVLEDASKWINNKPALESIPSIVLEFISASSEFERSVLADEAANLAERESALQLAEKAVEQREYAERRRRNATRLGLGVSLFLALFGLLLAMQSIRGVLTTQRYGSNLLAAEAERMGEAGNSRLSIMLALMGDPSGSDNWFSKTLNMRNDKAFTTLQRALVSNRTMREYAMPTPISTLELDQKSGLFVTGHQDGAIRVWEQKQEEPLFVSHIHEAEINSIAFDPNGESFATSDDEGRIVSWSKADFTHDIIQNVGIGALTLEYSPDGEFLVCGDRMGEITVWQTRPYEIRFTGNAGFGYGVTAIAFRSNSEQFVTGSSLGEMRLWDLNEAVIRQQFGGFADSVLNAKSVTNLKFLSDDETLLSRNSTGDTSVWKVGRTDPIQEEPSKNQVRRPFAFLDYSDDEVGSLEAMADGILVLSGIASGTIKAHEKEIVALAFHSPTNMAVSADEDFLRFWRVNAIEPEELGFLHSNSSETGWFQAANLDGFLFFTDEAVVQTLDAETSNSAQLLKLDKGLKPAVASNNRRYLLVTALEGRAHSIWDMELGRIVQSFNVNEERHMGEFKFHPTEPQFLRLIYREQDDELRGLVQHWHIGDTEPRREFDWSGRSFRGLNWLPDGVSFVAGARTGHISHWSLDGEVPNKEYTGHTDSVYEFVVHPEGEYFLSLSYDDTMKAWPITGGQPIQSFYLGPHAQSPSASFHPSGDFLLTNNRRHGIRVWKIGSQYPVWLPGFRGSFQAEFSPDGRMIAFRGPDRSIFRIPTHPALLMTPYQLEKLGCDVLEAMGSSKLTPRDMLNLPIFDGMDEINTDAC